MKTKLTAFLLLLAWGLSAQDPCPNIYQTAFLHGNTIRTPIVNQGTLFWEGGSQAGFDVPYDPDEPVSTIFTANLWLGGIDPGGNLKIAAPRFGLGFSSFDYWPGPLDGNVGQTEAATCENWNRIWQVDGADIATHRSDWLDNGVVDQPIASIYEWPGQGNPHFESAFGFALPDFGQGLAPFHDENGDGIYDPDQGDFPQPEGQAIIPSQMLWCVFNDNGNIHQETQGNAIQAEVQLTAWAMNCTDNDLLNETIFTSYKIINRAIEDLDEIRAGFFVDFDLGCFQDDLYGSLPDLHTFYAYNADAVDGNPSDDCGGVPVYGEEPPVQAVTFLNVPMTSFMNYYGGICQPFPQVTGPQAPLEYYRYLRGRWRDGSPMVAAGNGYGSGADTTAFAFPDFPADTNGWSMYQDYASFCDVRTIGAADAGDLQPGALVQMDVAWSFHRGAGLDFLENTEYMAGRIEQLRQQYDAGFANACTNVISGVGEALAEKVEVFPNPAADRIQVAGLPDGAVEWILVDIQGSVKAHGKDHSMGLEIPVGQLPNGLYFLMLKNGDFNLTHRVVIQR